MKEAWPLIHPKSKEGFQYFMTTVDEYSRFAKVTPLKRKSEASSKLTQVMNRFEGFNLGHDGGGLYSVQITGNSIISKHDKFIEIAFPEMDTSQDEATDYSDQAPDASSIQSQEYDSESDKSDTQDRNVVKNESHINDPLTYIPETPSSFRTELAEGSNSETLAKPDNTSHPYNLRPRNNRALPSSISTGDETSLKDALTSFEATLWKEAIQEEFETVQRAGTYQHVANLVSWWNANPVRGNSQTEERWSWITVSI